MVEVSKIRESFLQKKPVIVVDYNKEIEADFIFPSEIMTKDVINFMISKGKGLLCSVADEEYLLNKGFFRMPSNGLDKLNTNYFISVDYKLTDTGITSFERAMTIQKLAEKESVSAFKYPGHVQLLGSKDIFKRRGHTEASLELVSMAGFERFGTLIEILNEDGDSHDFDYIFDLAKKHDLVVVSTDEIYSQVVKDRTSVYLDAKANLPTEFGDFEIIGFKNNIDSKEHFALVKGELYDEPITVRIHSECVTGDSFHSLKCDCGSQLKIAMKKIQELGKGIIIYMRQEGRDIGITNKIKAYALQDKGIDTYDANEIMGLKADLRDYSAAAQILKSLNVSKIILLSNNPDKKEQLEKYGIIVEKMESLMGDIHDNNLKYLKTKKEKFFHKLDI